MRKWTVLKSNKHKIIYLIFLEDGVYPRGSRYWFFWSGEVECFYRDKWKEKDKSNHDDLRIFNHIKIIAEFDSFKEAFRSFKIQIVFSQLDDHYFSGQI